MNGKHMEAFLKMVLGETGSRCNPLNTGVICSLELVHVTILAAIFRNQKSDYLTGCVRVIAI